MAMLRDGKVTRGGRPNRLEAAVREAIRNGKRNLDAAKSLGADVNLRVLLQLSTIVGQHERAKRELERRRVKPRTDDEVKQLREKVLSFRELLWLSQDLQDRYGQPRRSASEVEVRNEAPLAVVVEGGLPWKGVAGADGVVVGAGDQSDGDAVKH